MTGKRGPKPEPEQIARAKGTNKGRKPGVIPTGPELADTPPAWMCDEESPIAKHALVEWKRLHPLLVAKGLLLEKYAGNFAMLCYDYGVWMYGVEVSIGDGLTVELRKINYRTGDEMIVKVMTRPEVIRAEKAQASYYRRGAAFGLTPSDDGALGLKTAVPDKAEDASASDVMERRKQRLTCINGGAQAT